MTCGIYSITNTATGRVYVGQSTHIERRWREHRHRLQNSTHGNDRLQKSWNSRGGSGFSFSVECVVVDPTNLTHIENIFLSMYRLRQGGVYNADGPAESPRTGWRHSEETREKMRLAASRRKPISDETRRKHSLAARGRRDTPQARLNKRLGNAHRSKPVSCFDAEGALVKTYSSTNAVADDGYSPRHVWAVCRGLRARHRGLVWRFL